MAANYTSLCLEHSEHLCDFAGTWGSSINRIQVLKSQLQEGKDTIFFLWTVITRSPTSHLNPVFLCVAPLPTCSETQNQTWTSRLLVRKVRTSRCLRRMPSAGLTSTHLTRDPEARPPAERWEWPSWVFTIVLRKWSFFYIKMMTNINISLKKKWQISWTNLMLFFFLLTIRYSWVFGDVFTEIKKLAWPLLSPSSVQHSFLDHFSSGCVSVGI